MKKEEINNRYRARLERHIDELKWLYMELYDNSAMLAELLEQMEQYYHQRNEQLQSSDREREECPDWYKGNDMLGMML